MEKELNINVSAIGNELAIRHGDAAPVFVYEGFNRLVHSVQSFIDLVKAKCGTAHCIINYNENFISALADDTVIDRNQDYIFYNFFFSNQFDEFKQVFERQINQKSFIDFLKRREPGEIMDLESLLAAIQNFRYVTNIAGDFSYDDNNNYTFMVKIGDAESTVKIPQYISANLEVYNDSKFFQSIEIEVEVVKPRSESERLAFTLKCPKLSKYLREAMLHEVEIMKNNLDGYLIVAGQWQ
ncbi:MAG: hypothetical protein WCP79_06815 [Bacillota bacterium]